MKRYILIAGGNFLRQCAGFLAHLIVAKEIGSSNFGTVTLAFSAFIFLAGVGDFGARYHNWRQIAVLEGQFRDTAALGYLLARFVFASVIVVLVNVFLPFFFGGILLTLLRFYSLGVVFNQIAFDWYFLSRDKELSLFLFNSLSGIIYLLGTIFFVRGAEDIVNVPLIFVGSFLAPALLIIPCSDGFRYVHRLRVLFHEKSIWDLARLPIRTSRYAPYDLLQRAYHVFMFVVIGIVRGERVVGEFRVAYLFYNFASTLSIYLGSTYFNRVARVSLSGPPQALVQRVMVILFTLLVPGSFVLNQILVPIVESYFGSGFVDTNRAAIPLIYGLVIPAMVNFLRETNISTGNVKSSAWSYLTTIVATSLLVIAPLSSNIIYISVSLLLGEFAGLVVMIRSAAFRISLDRWFSIISVSVLGTVGCLALMSLLRVAGNKVATGMPVLLDVGIPVAAYFTFLVIIITIEPLRRLVLGER